MTRISHANVYVRLADRAPAAWPTAQSLDAVQRTRAHDWKDGRYVPSRGAPTSLLVADKCRTPLASICCGSTKSRKPTSSTKQKSTTSCRTNSKSYNKLDNLSHSKSATEVHSKLHATISKSCSKSHTTCCRTDPQLIEVAESDTDSDTTCPPSHCVRVIAETDQMATQ